MIEKMQEKHQRMNDAILQLHGERGHAPIMLISEIR